MVIDSLKLVINVGEALVNALPQHIDLLLGILIDALLQCLQLLPYALVYVLLHLGHVLLQLIDVLLQPVDGSEDLITSLDRGKVSTFRYFLTESLEVWLRPRKGSGSHEDRQAIEWFQDRVV